MGFSERPEPFTIFEGGGLFGAAFAFFGVEGRPAPAAVLKATTVQVQGHLGHYVSITRLTHTLKCARTLAVLMKRQPQIAARVGVTWAKSEPAKDKKNQGPDVADTSSLRNGFLPSGGVMATP